MAACDLKMGVIQPSMIYPQSQDLESEDFAEETLTADDKKNPAPHGMYKTLKMVG